MILLIFEREKLFSELTLAVNYIKQIIIWESSHLDQFFDLLSK